MKSSLALVLAGLTFAACSDASAASFGGRIDIAATSSSAPTTTRYYSAINALSLYATTGSSDELLREAFFRKTYVNVGYTPIACPAGISGSCGQVYSITVDANNIP